MTATNVAGRRPIVRKRYSRPHARPPPACVATLGWSIPTWRPWISVWRSRAAANGSKTDSSWRIRAQG